MDLKNFISSGILEAFVLGLASAEECDKVLLLAAEHNEIKDEIIKIEQALEMYAQAHSIDPPKSLRTQILSVIDSLEFAPTLTEKSNVSDYKLWLNATTPPEEYEDMHMEVIAQTDNATTVIAWVKNGEIDHIHHDYTEKFLVVEGTCHAIIDGVHADYSIGDYVEFPIHVKHSYEVTSPSPMKVIACLDRSLA